MIFVAESLPSSSLPYPPKAKTTSAASSHLKGNSHTFYKREKEKEKETHQSD